MQGFWRMVWRKHGIFLQFSPEGTMEMSLNHTLRASQFHKSHVFLKALSESMRMERYLIVLQQNQVSLSHWTSLPTIGIYLLGKTPARNLTGSIAEMQDTSGTREFVHLSLTRDSQLAHASVFLMKYLSNWSTTKGKVKLTDVFFWGKHNSNETQPQFCNCRMER